MRSGLWTTEFWLAAHWTCAATGSVAALILAPPGDWPAALVTAGATVAILWFAGIITNNYAENRFRLKAHTLTQGGGESENEGESESDNKHPKFGFGQFAAVSDQQEGEEDNE